MQTQNGRQDVKLQETFPIEIKENNGFQVIDARELHSFLESKQRFTDWIKNRIKEYGFVENEDFSLFHKIMKQKKGRGGHNAKEYAITLDMAKELSMVERNEKGRQARKYFIAVEKEYKQELLQKLKSKPKQLSETASYKEGEVFITKLDTGIINGCFKNGELYFQLSKMLTYLNYASGSASQVHRFVSDTNLLKVALNEKKSLWFINFEGIKQVLDHTTKELSYKQLHHIYRLWGVNVSEDKNTKEHIVRVSKKRLSYFLSGINRVIIKTKAEKDRVFLGEVYELLDKGGEQ